MGKIDDMRRLREAQQAGAGAGPARRTNAEPADPNAELKGKCATCGKLRTLQNGLVSNHQKGLGKACPGSRKAPA
jgi:hypothetical protein